MPSRDQIRDELYPRHLTKTEIQNPFDVIAAIFDYQGLPLIREDMDELFRALVVGDYHTLSEKERSYLIGLYNNLRKITEASHIIYAIRKQSTKKPIRSRK
jgi:hypothetical protein